MTLHSVTTQKNIIKLHSIVGLQTWIKLTKCKIDNTRLVGHQTHAIRKQALLFIAGTLFLLHANKDGIIAETKTYSSNCTAS
jgi:hypothetical protein